MWDYLKDKAPEIIVMVVIFGGIGWLFPKVQNIEIDQSAIKKQVESNENRLERIAKASEAYGVKVAEVEMKRRVELASIMIDLMPITKMKEYATIVIWTNKDKHLVFRTTDFQKASIAHAIAAGHIESKVPYYTPRLSYLENLCESQGQKLYIEEGILKEKVIISRLTLPGAYSEIENDWQSYKKGSYSVKCNIKNTIKKDDFNIEQFCLSFTSEKIKALVGNSKLVNDYISKSTNAKSQAAD